MPETFHARIPVFEIFIATRAFGLRAEGSRHREKKNSGTKGNRNQGLFGYPMARIQEASRWLSIV